MKKKLKNRRLGAIIFASAIVISSAVGVSAPGITDTKSDMNVSMPELSEDSVNSLLESSAAETTARGEEEIDVTDINSVDGLISFVDSINNKSLNCQGKTINLNTDIAWSGYWEPIKSFNGTFNGNGYTISGLNNEFMAYAEENATIMNLNIEADIATTGNTGGVVATNQGLISNCTFKGTIMSDDDQLNIQETGCGGIVGVNTGRIEDCTVAEDSVISRDGVFCGGIAGISYILADDVNDAIQPGVYRCKNYAKVNCTKRSYKITCGATGGIVGLSKMASDDAQAVEAMTPQIAKCENYGTINSVGAATGGIVGLCSDTKVNECSNYGAVSQEDSLWTGGIVGSFNQENYYGDLENKNHKLFFVNKCRNEGFIQGISRVGGIVGGDENYSNSLHTQAVMNMNECVNTGDVYTTGFGGGMSGYSYSDISRCINTGDVHMDLSGQTLEQQGQNAVGGITSKTSKSISDCINIGEIQVHVDEDLPFTTYAGGIAGVVESVGDIDSCYSSGPLTGEDVSTTSENGKVLYGGVAGNAPVARVSKSTFNNSEGVAEKSIASYNGKDADTGLKLSQMIGKSATENMSFIFKSGNFKVAKNAIKEGVNYYLTPVLKNMATPYELDADKTIEYAAGAYLKLELPIGDGYTITPVDGYDPEKVVVNGDFEFKIDIADAYKDYMLTVTVDEVEVKPDEDGVYSLTEIEAVPIIRVTLKKPAVVPVTSPTTANGATAPSGAQNGSQNSTKPSETLIDDGGSTPTGDTDTGTISHMMLVLLVTCLITMIVFRKKKDLDRVD